MTDPATALADTSAREAALDTGRSILVQAPAGSGKTELLTMRFLKLLAEVGEPEEILAITFTKSATAEMRHRILKKLDQAKHCTAGGTLPEEGRPGLLIAEAALANSDARGWRLLEQPQRLNIQTIDSLCLSIARQMPLAAKLGGILSPTEQAEPLYRKAAQRTFDRLGGDDAKLNNSLAALLMLRDSNLADCEALLAKMLSTRDQWAHAFPLAGDVNWEEVRARMEAPFRREVERVLVTTRRLFSSFPEMTAELLELANYACQGEDLKIDILALAGATSLPGHDSPQQWKCIANLLLKKRADEWLEKASKAHGFPRGYKESFEARQKDRRQQLIADLQQIPGLLALLCDIRALPPTSYTDEEWRTLRHFFIALRQAVSALDSVFAEEQAVDFVEIGMSALQVLRGELAETNRIRHLLLDEFQDTSRRQHELVASLLCNWKAEDGRTLFLVGDPMQSIYMFRQADVELFDLVRKSGFSTANGNFPVASLKLTTNFRSIAGVVDPLNTLFGVVFPHERKRDSAGVDFLPGIAGKIGNPEGAFQVHAGFVQSQKKTSAISGDVDRTDGARETQRRETAEILDIVRERLPKIERALAANEEFTIAILGRAKNHLTAIAAALRLEGIAYRAVDLETLGERQEILDLQSIVRALMHPMDRIAWLAILRAPWCGLDLADLHRLCGTDERTFSSRSVQRQIEDRLHLLNEDAQQRVLPVMSVMHAAQRNRYAHGSFSSWIERVWTSLGGPACVDAAGYENARAYFAMLDAVTSDGIAATGEEMDDQLNRLFAKPDPAVSDRCGVQLMTIHKAKGLGFNLVIVPGLHRKSSQDKQPLIQYLDRTSGAGAEVLAAPIGLKGEKSSSLYQWIGRQKNNREAEERKRLLYVACTRAREELHLFGTATVTTSDVKPEPGSLLATAWPALTPAFQQRHHERLDNLVAFPLPAPETRALGGVIDLAAASGPSALRRLPTGWQTEASTKNVTAAATIVAAQPESASIARERPQAGRSRRVLGMAVHMLFERTVRLLQKTTSEEVFANLPGLRKKAAAYALNEGLVQREADACAAEAADALQSALSDEIGLWILKPHRQDRTESSWTGMLDGALTTLRIDRSFLAGDDPLSEDGDTLWIVDYKTGTHSGSGVEGFIETEWLQYKEQLEKYGRMMRLARRSELPGSALNGPELRLRLGLYYPMLRRLKCWQG
jgi:ATP-dependent exoDNAse (exonuclease V) beta subunit